MFPVVPPIPGPRIGGTGGSGVLVPPIPGPRISGTGGSGVPKLAELGGSGCPRGPWSPELAKLGVPAPWGPREGGQ